MTPLRGHRRHADKTGQLLRGRAVQRPETPCAAMVRRDRHVVWNGEVVFVFPDLSRVRDRVSTLAETDALPSDATS
jgi:hypothetical protein